MQKNRPTQNTDARLWEDRVSTYDGHLGVAAQKLLLPGRIIAYQVRDPGYHKAWATSGITSFKDKSAAHYSTFPFSHL